MNQIDQTAKIGENVTMRDNIVIGANVIIGDNCFIDYGVIIKENVTIGCDSFIGIRCVLGEYNSSFLNNKINYINPPLTIGKNAVIRSDSIFYAGSVVGDNLQTGHRVTVREKTEAGKNWRVGTLSDIQGDCIIGDFVNMHSNVHIGQKSRIEDFVWIFPYVVLTNDPTPPSEILLGVTLEKFSVIATMSVILPGVVVREGALVGAGSIVGKTVNADMIAVGNPSKEVGNITRLKNRVTGEEVYPWQNHFSRGMPWSESCYEEWSKENIKK